MSESIESSAGHQLPVPEETVHERPASAKRGVRERAVAIPESSEKPAAAGVAPAFGDEPLAEQAAVHGEPQLTTDPAEAIRTRAYYRYHERGGAPGNALDDWLEAEREQTRLTGG